jgi:hypothetical protein
MQTITPTFTHHCNSEYILCIRDECWCGTIYESEKVCNDVNAPLQCTVIFNCCKNLLYSTYSSIPPPKPRHHWSFYCLYSFASIECYLVGITQCVVFSDWFLSLNNIHLKLLHVFLWLVYFFLAVNDILLLEYECTTVNSLIYLRTPWLLLSLYSFEWSCYKHLWIQKHLFMCVYWLSAPLGKSK